MISGQLGSGQLGMDQLGDYEFAPISSGPPPPSGPAARIYVNTESLNYLALPDYFKMMGIKVY
jgi:hypothetical protein